MSITPAPYPEGVGAMTVPQAHRVVRLARTARCRRGRPRMQQPGRRLRRLQVSQYRAVTATVRVQPAAADRQPRSRRTQAAVAAVTLAAAVLVLGLSLDLQPGVANRALDVEVLLALVAGALWLNAITCLTHPLSTSANRAGTQQTKESP